MKTTEIPIERVRSIGKGELAGVMDDEFPVFQKDRNSASDFPATAVKRMFVFVAYRRYPKQKKKCSR
ncbi:hypothetical protein LWM68_10495 [Niabella sp. W65]|nr:hypothetical protein [Niabella sp. W65]MCH7363155.1 hypothetical protein [Niabella sp. W65]ULT39082.1 hypothetical protein KRR40_29205 [Niabella sp. I65]